MEVRARGLGIVLALLTGVVCCSKPASPAPSSVETGVSHSAASKPVLDAAPAKPATAAKAPTADAAPPVDPAALVQRSIQLYDRGEIEEAEATAEQASKTEGPHRFDALTQLAKIREAKGEYSWAVSHYEDALELRRDPAIEARLKRANDEVVQRLNPRVIARVEGPNHLCKDLSLPDALNCKLTPTELPIRGTTGPFEKVALWRAGKSAPSEGFIAVKAGGHWHQVGTLYTVGYPDDPAKGALTSARVLPIGGKPVLRIEGTFDMQTRFMGTVGKLVVFCGVGPSTRLSCTPTITTVAKDSSWGADGDGKSSSTIRFRVDLDRRGTLRVKPSRKLEQGSGYLAQVGTARLEFP